MSNLIRVADQLGFAPSLRWEPFGLMHEIMSWDPFADARLAARSRQLAAFAPRFDLVALLLTARGVFFNELGILALHLCRFALVALTMGLEPWRKLLLRLK